MSKSSNNQVLKAGLGYTIGNYLLKGLSFLTIPIFSRIMSTTDYGTYNTFIAYEGMLFVLIGLAIHTSYKNARYKYSISDDSIDPKNDYNTYVSSTMILLLLSLCVWFIMGNLFGEKLSVLLGLDIITLNLLLIYSFSMAVIQCYNADLALRYQFQSFLKISGINAVTSIVLSILLMTVVFSEQRYLGRIIGSIIPVLIIAIYVICSFLKKAKPANVSNYLKWGIKYSLPIVPHGISQVILSQFDRIMINNLIGAATAGIYSFAYNIYTIVAVTTQSLDGVWCPWFYEQMASKNYAEIKKRSGIYVTAMAMFFGVILLISPELVKFLGTKEYWDASYCVIPIMVGAFFSFLYNLPSAVEYYYEKTKYIALGTMGAAIINIILNYIFVLRYGYIAAAYTTLVTYFLYFLFHFVLAWRIQKSCIFSLKAIVISSVLVLSLGAIALILIDVWNIRWILAIIIGIAFLVYVVIELDIIKKLKNRRNRAWKK